MTIIPPHGASRYRHHGCRCDICRAANTAAQAAWRKRNYLAGGSLTVDPTGSIRRVQALVALGWTYGEIGARLGWTRHVVRNLIASDPTYVLRSTHIRICRAYERMCMTIPPEQTNRARGYRARTRRMAAARGWLPPLAWDDIDDIDETPEMSNRQKRKYDIDPVVVQRILDGENLPASKAEKVEVTRRWVATGRPLRHLAELTGWKTERYVEREETAA